jgi:hypothetical protein
MRKAGNAQPMEDGAMKMLSLTMAALSGAGFVTAKSGH